MQLFCVNLNISPNLYPLVGEKTFNFQTSKENRKAFIVLNVLVALFCIM